jgi:hypothetical protein
LIPHEKDNYELVLFLCQTGTYAVLLRLVFASSSSSDTTQHLFPLLPLETEKKASSSKEETFLTMRKADQLPYAKFENGSAYSFIHLPVLGMMKVDTYEKALYVYSYFYQQGLKTSAQKWMNLAWFMHDAPQ